MKAVVVFLLDQSDPRLRGLEIPPSANPLYTTDPYAVAAELLIAPDAVLVVDLPALRKNTLGLLTLAERLGVPCLALGERTQSWMQAAKFQQVLPQDLADTLADVLDSQELQPASTPTEVLTRDESVPLADTPSESPQADAETAPTDNPDAPRPCTAGPLIEDQPFDILTAEEIAALLNGHM